MYRREFIGGLAAMGLLPAACGADENDANDELWLSAQGDSDERFGVAMLERGQRSAVVVRSGFRGHDLAQSPTRPEQVVMFGRRPGRYGLVVDVVAGAEAARFDAAPGHSLMGHGFFSPDGALLYTVEADNVSGAGVLVVRETQNWSPTGALATSGIGPHQAQLMPDGRTAVVGNGGILTRPETGREKLNLDTMESTLTYIDVGSGEVLEQLTVPESKASIRHLEVGADGLVVFGVQVQRDATGHQDLVPLAGVHRRGESVRLFESASEVIAAMDDYVGSVAVNPLSRIAGFTSPRGDRVAFWDIDSGAFVGEHRLADVSGITVSKDSRRFILSNSLGDLRHLDAFSLEENREARTEHPNIRWDNHLITASR